ncbi:MAG: 1,4-dihydroxy-6-naphtoate synthase [Syntrophorhabdus sp. PtaB.Bin006]|nr:MAG: 1,4-dihydroxy-6-naphtoate synthase [Syntrophorhabdus sp. PtaB.Bin006]
MGGLDLSLAFSPCPNDTFIFHALLHNCIDRGPFSFTAFMDDVETLNQEAFKERFQITKLSFFAYLHLKDRYELLDAGAALGYGCGPLVVAKSKDILLSGARIAVPGAYTTAHLLLRLWHPGSLNIEVTRFDDILPGIESGKYDAGVIIHEGRFVYSNYGCSEIVDLGAWWEKETGLPIPLGCIALLREPSIVHLKEELERLIRNSIQYGFDNRAASRDFIKSHAQELDDDVIDSHIGLYVNRFSLSLGAEGGKAIATLEEMARCRNIL